MRRISICILTVILLNCKQSKNEDSNSLAQSDTIQFEKSKRKKTFEQINQILYDNLVGVERGPFPEKNDSGYVDLDVDGYIEGLRTHEIYNEEFFKHERERVEPCLMDLKSIRYTGDPEPGNWEPSSCFFFHMYWLRSQESPVGYEVKNLVIDGDKAKSEMVFYDESNGEKTYWDGHVYLEIHYFKEQGDWRIVQILRLPKD